MWELFAQIALYAGILSLVTGIVSRFFRLYLLGMAPARFMDFAQCLFLIALVILGLEILKQLRTKKE